jgi:hypothetical protein
MGRKVGPNFEDENRIREWREKGKSAQQISDLLLIELQGVEIFLAGEEDYDED